ncbi:MAG TPA: hypothetical protein VEU76_10950 [Candidatus Udaeobacter sp.]|nr:hypothetical protein [Candidatus Udaeobacter sp.]
MNTPSIDRDRAVKLYARLVALYPAAHREKFGPQMQHTFADLYRNATARERRVGVGFWLAVLWDEGRSIVRERAAEPQGDVLFYSLVLVWGLLAMVLPVIPASSDWHNLVLPTAALAVLFLTIPGRSGVVRRLVTAVAVLTAVEFMTSVAQSMREPNDLLAPVLLVACLVFTLKIMSGANARIVGKKDTVWDREELAFGALAGLAGVVGLAPGLVNTGDDNPAFGFFFYLVVPFVCAAVGFRVGRRYLSVRSGIYAALGSLLIAATIWLLALPILYEGAVLTVYRGHVAPALFPLFWQQPLSLVFFWTALNAGIGAFFGVEILSKDKTIPQSPASS